MALHVIYLVKESLFKKECENGSHDDTKVMVILLITHEDKHKDKVNK